jgi:hypothetical protein
MSTTPPPPPRPGRVVVQSTSNRDILIAVGVALVVLGLVVAGMLALRNYQAQPSKNQLTGVITAKHDIGEREQQISIGRKGLATKDGDSGYSFDVRVEPSGRVYEIPVTKQMFQAKKVGDKQTFIRPPSEQR